MKSLLQKIEVLHDDDDIIVINKPAELLTIPDRYRDLPNVMGYYKREYGEIFMVHRLDRDTSGVMILAKHETAHKNLSKQFEDHTVTKQYKAIVKGYPNVEGDTIDLPIVESSKKGKMTTAKKGKASITKYQLVKQYGQYALLDVTLLTGRTHQIRVHLSAIGLPLAVDALYSKRDQIKLSEFSKKRIRFDRDTEERPLVKRHSLHSYQLAIDHPTTRERLHWLAELPKDLKALIYQLEKAYG